MILYQKELQFGGAGYSEDVDALWPEGGIDFSYDGTSQAGASGLRDVQPWGLGSEHIKIDEIKVQCFDGTDLLKSETYNGIFNKKIEAYDPYESSQTGAVEYRDYRCNIR